jgi:hypothetical protein
MSAAVAEFERRFRGGVRGVATAEARANSTRARENAASAARDHPTLLGVGGVLVAGAVAYGVYALVSGTRERQKPQNRLKRGVSQFGAELSERVSGRVESSRRQLERTLPHGIFLKFEPESGGYMRVSDARLEPPDKGKARLTVIKRLLWAGFLAVFMAVGAVMARRLADGAWRAMVREEPPSDRSKAEY